MTADARMGAAPPPAGAPRGAAAQKAAFGGAVPCDGPPVDAKTGATVCAQLQEAGRRALGRGGGRVPPPGTTWEEMLECECDQEKQ